MSYESTALGSLGVLGTVGSGAATGAEAGGSAGGGGGVSAGAVSDAASGVVSGILSIYGAVTDIRAWRTQRQAGASASQQASAGLLDDALFGRQTEAMARDEARAQQGVQSQMGVQLTQAETDLQRQAARIRQSQVQQEIAARVGGQFGRSRSLSTWAWVGIGVGGVGLTLLVVWLVSRRG